MTERQPKGIPTGGQFAASQHPEAEVSLAPGVVEQTPAMNLDALEPAQVDRMAVAVSRPVYRRVRTLPPDTEAPGGFDDGYERGLVHADTELLTVLTHADLAEADLAERRDLVTRIARETTSRSDFLLGVEGSTGMAGESRSRWTDRFLTNAIDAYAEQRTTTPAEEYRVGSAAGRRHGYADAAAALITGSIDNESSEVCQRIEDGIAAGCKSPDEISEYLFYRSTASKETVDAYDWGNGA